MTDGHGYRDGVFFLSHSGSGEWSYPCARDFGGDFQVEVSGRVIDATLRQPWLLGDSSHSKAPRPPRFSSRDEPLGRARPRADLLGTKRRRRRSSHRADRRSQLPPRETDSTRSRSASRSGRLKYSSTRYASARSSTYRLGPDPRRASPGAQYSRREQSRGVRPDRGQGTPEPTSRHPDTLISHVRWWAHSWQPRMKWRRS